METKLCRICGKLGQNYVHIFKTEGLKNKVETCLPIIVSPHTLLPDTICGECSENVDNFYSFIKNCLQNIIILEAQYDITESCLKTKRKHEKSCTADISTRKQEKSIQTDDYLDVLLRETNETENLTFPLTSRIYDNLKSSLDKNRSLVDYDIESDNNSEIEHTENNGKVVLTGNKTTATNSINEFVDNIFGPKNNVVLNKQYFDDRENDLISEIAQRKTLKRKSDSIESHRTKIFKMDTSNRRKCKQPKKLEVKIEEIPRDIPLIPQMDTNFDFNTLEKMYEQLENGSTTLPNEPEKLENTDISTTLDQVEIDPNVLLPQICLLCNVPFMGIASLAGHVLESHGIDMAQVVSSITDLNSDKKKKLPNLLKISDLKRSDSTEDNQQEIDQKPTEEPTLLPEIVCTCCPSVFTSRPDLFSHWRIKHPEQASLLCGLCLYQATSYVTLKSHLETCSQQNQITTRYFCQICRYGEDNSKMLEQHILVHEFLLEICKKEARMFDPDDYIEANENYDFSTASPGSNNLSCSECGMSSFESFKDFSTHRRSKHSIFHCDLCNKFYGRNSHLWKHVNRLHKGHPSITCQLCYKTSASKYHLQQHFNKIHTAKPCKIKTKTPSTLPSDVPEDFMSQKFQAFDFQSVKQSFMRQEILKHEHNVDDNEENTSNNQLSEEEIEEKVVSPVTIQPFIEPPYAPKEIDASSDLYTNIITNYTPPANTGEFKCPQCSKGFHKKTLVKKHKKNCRPRLQKDLLTRCKSCARIFKDRQSLAKHLINYHSEYACELCGQKVQSKCEIVAHIRFTHPTCHLICNICGNILRSREDLIEHKQDHSNSYICQFCADALPSKIKLKMHILSLHRKILSLSCGVCLKLFETQHVLRDHVRLIHKDQLAPLTSCPVCGKNYGSKWKTYDHLNKSHGRIFKACKVCLEVFNTDYELDSHSSIVHANQTVSNNSNNGKNNTLSNINQNINSNKTYISESEIDQDENSEQSNDANNFNDLDEKSFDYISNFPEISPKDTKISLLEKRLLGKKITEEDTKCLINQNKIIKTTVSNKVKQNKKSNCNSSESDDVIQNSNPQHNSSKRTVYVNSNDPSLCEICLKVWPAKKHLWQHYIRCHKSVAATVCGICLKTNTDYTTLQEHLQENHPMLLHGKGFGSNFICRICGRYHNASSKLKLHMTIHESFDWSLLETSNNTNKEIEKPPKPSTKTNGYPLIYKKDSQIDYNNENEVINYDSLIEQVDCSSESENEESENNNISSSEGEEEEDDEEDEDEEEGEEEPEIESSASEPSLESEMLKNMLTEKQRLLLINDDKIKSSGSESENTNSNSSYSGIEDNDDKSEVDEIKSEIYDIKSEADESNMGIKNEVFSSDEASQNSDNLMRDSISALQNNTNSYNDVIISGNRLFTRKSEELDSAIKSISYECISQINDDIDDDYCDLQAQSLNENEIESAVGSIL